MSLRTIVEVAVHFESFRNVDLFHQGLYHLRVRLFREDDEQRLMAVPYACQTYPTSVADATSGKSSKSTRTDHHHLIPAHIMEEQYTFSTRSFLIRYCEEEVELNDLGQFRLELGEDLPIQEGPLSLEVDLMFADLTQHGGADRFGESPDVDSAEFTSVSTQTYRIYCFESGLHESCPVVFDEFHFCVANLAVHTAATDIRFRLRPNALQHLKPKPATPKDGQPAPAVAAPVTTPTVPKTQNSSLALSECLFWGVGQASLMTATEEFYSNKLCVLAKAYSELAQWYQQVTTRCLTPAQRDVFGEILVIEPPKLPCDLSLAALMSGDNGSAQRVRECVRSTLRATLGKGLDERSLACHVAHDLNLVSQQIMDMWHKCVNTMTYCHREVATLLRASWEKKIVRMWTISINKEIVPSGVAVPAAKAIWEQHQSKADQMRIDAVKTPADIMPIEDLSLKPRTELHPMLFEQRYTSNGGAAPFENLFREKEDSIPSEPKRYRGVHLFVLVHGFQGNSFDMRLMKNNIALLNPDAVFLCSNSNEDNTEGDMNEMGIRLAQEVVNYICDWCPGSALGRLSFIAHSLGGLIVRAALPLLHEYAGKMHTFLTLSTPHLGYFQNTLSLFNTGFWVLKKWRKSTCLEQMAMTDATEPKDTFLFRLSKTKGFEFFQSVVLVSSYQDQYAPFESARIECSAGWDKTVTDVCGEMVQNLWRPVKQERVFRLDVNFNIPEKNLDTFIGRAAHIQFLESQPIMKMILHNYSFLFR